MEIIGLYISSSNVTRRVIAGYDILVDAIASGEVELLELQMGIQRYSVVYNTAEAGKGQKIHTFMHKCITKFGGDASSTTIRGPVMLIKHKQDGETWDGETSKADYQELVDGAAMLQELFGGSAV